MGAVFKTETTMLDRTRHKATRNALPDWSRRFEPAIPIQNGRSLFTLRDAGKFIEALPKAEHDAPRWRTAIELLLFVAEKGAPVMMARVAMMRALHHREPQGDDAASTTRPEVHHHSIAWAPARGLPMRREPLGVAKRGPSRTRTTRHARAAGWYDSGRPERRSRGRPLCCRLRTQLGYRARSEKCQIRK
jgi:hypothetical protein